MQLALMRLFGRGTLAWLSHVGAEWGLWGASGRALGAYYIRKAVLFCKLWPGEESLVLLGNL